MSQTLDLAGGNYVTTKAGIAAGTTTTLTTANTVQFAIKGVAYSAAGASNVATPTTDAVLGTTFAARPVLANQGSVFLVGFTAAGALAVAQGDIKALDVGGNFIDAPQLPTATDAFAPFGYIVIKCGATASAWTFGSSNLSGATGVTYSFKDILTLPTRPVIA